MWDDLTISPNATSIKSHTKISSPLGHKFHTQTLSPKLRGIILNFNSKSSFLKEIFPCNHFIPWKWKCKLLTGSFSFQYGRSWYQYHLSIELRCLCFFGERACLEVKLICKFPKHCNSPLKLIWSGLWLPLSKLTNVLL